MIHLFFLLAILYIRQSVNVKEIQEDSCSQT